jgi:PAS domain S-box-containing protein
VSRSRHLKLDAEYGFEHFVKERDFYPERQPPPQTPPMMRSWPRRPKWTTTPSASPVIRYVLAPVSVTLALALSRMFLYFHWPQPFTALAISAIAITFWYGSTTSGIIATLIALLVRNSFFQPETSIMARALYDLVFLVFALLMFRVTRDQNQLETKVVEQNADLAHANAVLRREEARSRMLTDAIPQQIWSGLPDGTLDYCNERWRIETGLGLEELQGDGWQTILHPDDRDRVLNAWRHSVAAGTPYEQEERHRQADGTYRWFLARGVPLLDSEGHIVRWFGTNTDIQDRKHAEEDLRRISGQLLHSQDEERRRIAADLHDSTGQDLVALATTLSQLHDSISPGQRKSRKVLSQCKSLVDSCIRDVRTLSYLLHPPLLNQGGLEDAIRDYVQGFAKRSGIRVALDLSPGIGRMARDVELTLFRVVQEGLTNVQRHSGSDRAEVRIHRHSDLLLEIIDHGSNTSDSAPHLKEGSRYKVGVGILSMQQRVKLIGGQIDIRRTNSGTTVSVRLPCHLSTNEM